MQIKLMHAALRLQHNLTLFGRYVDQGGGKRKGAFAVYLEPWHSDIFEWLDLRKNHGKEEVIKHYEHCQPGT